MDASSTSWSGYHADLPIVSRGSGSTVPGPSVQELPGENGEQQKLQLYLAQRDVLGVLPDLAAAIPPAPPFPGVAERLHQRSIWLGCRGTQTPLHRDPYHNLFCQACPQDPQPLDSYQTLMMKVFLFSAPTRAQRAPPFAQAGCILM